MRILITGSRNWTDERVIARAMACAMDVEARSRGVVIVHGGAQGADSLAGAWCKRWKVPTEVHKPDYTAFPGHLAPLKRNDAMLDSLDPASDLVLAFMLGTPEKGGTLYTVSGARKRGLPVIVYNWPGDVDADRPRAPREEG